MTNATEFLKILDNNLSYLNLRARTASPDKVATYLTKYIHAYPINNHHQIIRSMKCI